MFSHAKPRVSKSHEILIADFQDKSKRGKNIPFHVQQESLGTSGSVDKGCNKITHTDLI